MNLIPTYFDIRELYQNTRSVWFTTANKEYNCDDGIFSYVSRPNIWAKDIRDNRMILVSSTLPERNQ